MTTNGPRVLLLAPLNAVLYLTGVGSKGFVEHVKSALGALAKGRKAKESGDSYQLREPSQRLIKQIAWPDPGLQTRGYAQSSGVLEKLEIVPAPKSPLFCSKNDFKK